MKWIFKSAHFPICWTLLVLCVWVTTIPQFGAGNRVSVCCTYLFIWFVSRPHWNLPGCLVCCAEYNLWYTSCTSAVTDASLPRTFTCWSDISLIFHILTADSEVSFSSFSNALSTVSFHSPHTITMRSWITHIYVPNSQVLVYFFKLVRFDWNNSAGSWLYKLNACRSRKTLVLGIHILF